MIFVIIFQICLGMSVFLKNTSFHGILLDSLFDAGSDNSDKKAVVRLLTEGLKNGAVRPLQTTVFSEDQVEQAFRYELFPMCTRALYVVFIISCIYIRHSVIFHPDISLPANI